MKYLDLIITIYASIILIITFGFREHLPEQLNNYWWIFIVSILILILAKRIYFKQIFKKK